MAQALWKIVWQFLTKLNIHLYDAAAELLHIYPGDMHTYVHTHTHKKMCDCPYQVYLQIAGDYKHPKCSVGKRINCDTSILWDTTSQKREKNIDTLIHPLIWMVLKDIVLSEKVSVKGHILHDSIYITSSQ